MKNDIPENVAADWINHIEVKLSAKSIVLRYSDRNVAIQSIQYLECMAAKHGIENVEYVFSQENFNVIVYFKHRYALEEFNSALNPAHYLVA